ncbi:MAG: hypothetical protein ABIK09_02185 [Pseudomonadota bacterium]
MNRTLCRIMVVLLALVAGGCSGPQIKGPLDSTELRALKGAHALEGVAVVLYHEQMSEPEAQGIYDKLLGLGMRDTLFEPGLGVGGPRMIMYRAERQGQAEWLKAHVWELRDYGLMLETSATDIYVNTW